MRYVLVENGKMVDGPRTLPQNWKNISGFNLLSEDKVLSLGWRRYRFVPWEGDMVRKVTVASRFEITSTEYIEYQQVREKTQDEINNEAQSLWPGIRERRNQLLAESDWTQLYDSPLSVEKKTEWATYRQNLRDLTTDFPNPQNLVWPDPPQQ